MSGQSGMSQTMSRFVRLRGHRRAEKKIKSKKNMEDRLPEPITLQTRQNSIGNGRQYAYGGMAYII
jgi:hypothetical protein